MKKEKRNQQATSTSLRNQQNNRIHFVATHDLKNTLDYLNTSLLGLDEEMIEVFFGM